MLPEKSRIEEIIKIHNELQKLYYSGLDRAIRLVIYLKVKEVIKDLTGLDPGD